MQKFIIMLTLLVCAAGILAQDGTKTIAGGVVNGKAISLPVPDYPASARAVNAAGSVNVQVEIDEQGNVVSATAISGHPLLRSSSVTAALTAKFKPTLLSGVPVRVKGIIVYNYTLPSEEDIEPLEYLRLSAFLRIVDSINSNADFNDGSEGFFVELGKYLVRADLPEEFASLRELSSATAQRRTVILDELTRVLKKNQTVTKTWEVSVGEVLGGLLFEGLRFSSFGVSDQAKFRGYSNNLRNLMKTAPANFPAKLKADIQAVTDLAERTDFDDPDSLKSLIARIDLIGDSIFGPPYSAG